MKINGLRFRVEYKKKEDLLRSHKDRRMKNSMLVIIAVGVLLVGSLAGCASTPAAQPVPSAQTAGGTNTKGTTGKTWDTVKAQGHVIVGIGQEAAPFGFRENNELVGFDFEIARAVVKRLEVYAGKPITLEFKPVTDETRISWVQSGEVHMSLDHTNITRKRLENIDFSVPYGWDGKSVLYRTSDGTRDLADFARKTIGIKRSSSSEGEITAYFAAKGWAAPILKQFDNHAAGIQALLDGQIDGFTDDNSIIINTAVVGGHKVGAGGELAITATSYSPAYFGIGVPQNDSHWRNVLNYALQDLWLSGDYQIIYTKWFGPDSRCPIPLGDHHMEPFVNG
jgi:polar amino acid transport system substrate-binding protein